MFRPTGSWVAMPTPFSKDNKIDFGAFKLLIDRQIQYGTSELFILGSAGETTLLSIEEKKEIIKNIIKITKGRIPVFFGCAAPTTEGAVDLARFCESENADGIVFTVPPYVLIPQDAVLVHLDACMSSVNTACGIYNNPSRLGVNVDPETIFELVNRHPNFVADKEAMPYVSQLVDVKRLCGDKLNILCCDFPKYSIVIPTLAIGGNGTANIGGNIIPEEAAIYSRPWTDMKIIDECKKEYFKRLPLLKELYRLSNPIVIKAALNILGLPGGHLRKPYLDYAGRHLESLKNLLNDTGIVKKYGV
ncbi:MAG: dihydrodipicolinate synthase family protein [Elusimicrobiota bacterium]|jgi:4-hydroxy-tetrahydrodipicolinate synthase|nr:dihydrodipicolinate synthase family protein [Elusimicrobiota bacterium]